MKAARPTPLTFTALSCVLLLPIASGACGTEAPAPVVIQGASGMSVIPSGGGSAGTGMNMPVAGTSATPIGGTGTTPTGGTGTTPTGGTGTTPTGGTGTGGMAGTATGGGTTGGTGTMGGMGMGGGTPVDLKEVVAGPLNGQMLKGPCISDFDPLVCKTGDCAGGDNPDFPLSGALTTDTTITLGGDPAKVYTITLHVQGEVEAKSYGSAGDQEKSKQSPAADGFQVGGTPTKGDAYNVYMLRVTSPKQDYFFNALVPPGISDHTTYGIDYIGKVQANGGSKIRLVAADRNCSMIKNCGPVNNGMGCNSPITIANVDAVAKTKNPNFNFSQPFNGQWVVMVVTDVKEN